MDFNSLEDEEYRTYEFPGGDSVTIKNPVKLNVSASGGHRVLDADGTSHYVPAKWIHLFWQVKTGKPAFAF